MMQFTYCVMKVEELLALKEIFSRTPEFLNEYPLELFNMALLRGELQLWVEPDALNPAAAMVTQIQYFAGGKQIVVLAFGGRNVDTTRTLWNSIKNWAQKNGAKRIRAICKDPQARLFARDGFVKVANVIELELDHVE